MYARFLDVLHNSGDQHIFGIGQRVYVNFRRIFQEPIDEYGPFLRENHCLAHIAPDRLFLVGNYHGTAAKYVTGTDEHRISYMPRYFARTFHTGRSPVFGTWNTESLEQLAKELTVLGQIDVFGIGADDGNAQFFQRDRQIQGSLPSELHDHTVGLFRVIDIQHMLESEWFKIQP